MSQTQLDREIQLEDGTTANCGLCLKENAIYMFVLGSKRFYLGEKCLSEYMSVRNAYESEYIAALLAWLKARPVLMYEMI